MPTAGLPTVISQYVYVKDSRLPWADAQPLRRLVQVPEDGAEIRIETRASEIFLPSTFDAAKPFHIELEFTPGIYQLGTFIQVGARSP